MLDFWQLQEAPISSVIEFPCPECGVNLAVLPDCAETALECPHCYAVVLLPARDGAQGAETTTAILEESPLRVPRKHDRDSRVSDIFFLWVTSIVLRFVFPIPAFLTGLIWIQFASFTSPIENGDVSQFLMSIPLIVGAVHSFVAGRSLARLESNAIRVSNIFLAVSIVYSLVFWIGFAIRNANERGVAGNYGASIAAWLFLSCIPIMFLCVYLNVSERVKSLYLKR